MARISVGRAHNCHDGVMARRDADDVIRQTLVNDRHFFVGDAVSISPETAISLNLALHELATKTAKYGGLSTPEGHVEILLPR